MEKVISFSWDLAILILYVSLVVYIIQSKEVYSYVKGVFLTCLFFKIVWWVFDTLIYTFYWESLRPIFGWDGSNPYIPNFLSYTSSFLMLFGVCLLMGKSLVSQNESNVPPAMTGTRRHIGISLLLFVVTLGIYYPFWLYRTVKDLKNNFGDDIPYTPGKAVGYLFIPVFNIYWGFYILFSLPLKIKWIEDKRYGRNIGFYFHPILIPILIIIFGVAMNLQVRVSLEKAAIGSLLFFQSAMYVLWLTVQAKLNAFFDYKKSLTV